ncbi:hypothetical protein [Microbacterium sp. CFBP9034]|uniref:hypothetical protein n=1 Tax=Microbacterium sp. CFBP9034 TaxID=3096540 RepID=UPI002A69C3B4|nr:hypothetical protein [Microbacterium sp. CFBP9034]MDY0910576.1 hypothetical protein [Microbacterium sp. CFBP9034]
MKKWIVRFVSLLVFNVVVLLVIGFLTPAKVGWSALWAGIVLTAIEIWIKPLVVKWFGSMAAKSAHQRTKAGQKLVEFFLAFAVALLVWIATVFLSGVSVGGWFWGYVLPPVILLIGWAIYDAIDDRVHEHAGALYDRAGGGAKATTTTDATPPAIPSPESRAARRELQDGLTEEQRRMLDELGKG